MTGILLRGLIWKRLGFGKESTSSKESHNKKDLRQTSKQGRSLRSPGWFLTSTF